MSSQILECMPERMEHEPSICDTAHVPQELAEPLSPLRCSAAIGPRLKLWKQPVFFPVSQGLHVPEKT
jgi:hypothetical protein